MSKIIDMTGWVMKEHGVPDSRLTVLQLNKEKKRGKLTWRCKCDCGNVVNVCGCRLRSGGTKSCGCLRIETVVDFNVEHRTTHHERRANSRLYVIWGNIKVRCNNQKDKAYPNYGGRGIKMCADWLNYENFRDWAWSNGYNEQLTIDRIDNDGNYEPSNCRWVTYKEQNNNKRGNIVLESNGESHTMSEWEDIYNLKRGTIGNRLRSGWSVEDAIHKPVRKWVKHNV